MSDVSKFLGGNYFSQVDLPQNWQQWRIANVEQRLVGQSPPELKICVQFNEHSKLLILNQTNLTRVAELYTTESSRWIGRRLLVYRSITSFNGQRKLCVRLCGPTQSPPEPIYDQHGNLVQFVPPIAPVHAGDSPVHEGPVDAPWTDEDNTPSM